MNLRSIFYNLVVGLPGGFLIIMSMLMLNALLGRIFLTGTVLPLVILSITSLLVGLLARLIQPFHGAGSALASGVIAALLLLYLWGSSTSALGLGSVVGPAGMLVTLGFSLLGSWLFTRLWK